MFESSTTDLHLLALYGDIRVLFACQRTVFLCFVLFFGFAWNYLRYYSESAGVLVVSECYFFIIIIFSSPHPHLSMYL